MLEQSITLKRIIHKRKARICPIPALIGRQDGFTVSQEIKEDGNEERSANTAFVQTVVTN